MPKKNLAGLLNEEFEKPQSTETQTSDLTDKQNSKLANTQTYNFTEQQSTKLTESQSQDVPKYLTLERKEVRFTPEQLDSLTTITRRLNRSRKGQGERITDNTLVRVATQVLIENAGVLSGMTEEELLASFREWAKQRSE